MVNRLGRWLGEQDDLALFVACLALVLFFAGIAGSCSTPTEPRRACFGTRRHVTWQIVSVRVPVDCDQIVQPSPSPIPPTPAPTPEPSPSCEPGHGGHRHREAPP